MNTRLPQDEWGFEAPAITSPERLSAIKEALDQSPIIVEHWFFRGGCAPSRLIFEDYEEFLAYLKTRTAPGDAIHVWRYDLLCRDDNSLAHGKYPDADGMTPKRGAY